MLTVQAVVGRAGVAESASASVRKLRPKWLRVSTVCTEPTASTPNLQTLQRQLQNHKPWLLSHLSSVEWPRRRLAKRIMTTLSDLGLLKRLLKPRLHCVEAARTAGSSVLGRTHNQQWVAAKELKTKLSALRNPGNVCASLLWQLRVLSVKSNLDEGPHRCGNPQ